MALYLRKGRYKIQTDYYEHASLGNFYKGFDTTKHMYIEVTTRELAPEAKKDIIEKTLDRLKAPKRKDWAVSGIHKNLIELLWHEQKIQNGEETHWIVLENYQRYLKQYVKEQGLGCGHLDREIEISIMQDCSEAIKFLHDLQPPMYHRLLKPKAILIKTDEKSRPIAKISDYFMADIFEKTSAWKEYSTLKRNASDMYFLPPEYFLQGSIPSYEKCTAGYDVFSLGAIFHALLSGSAESFWPITPDQVCIGKCLSEGKEVDLFAQDETTDRETRKLQNMITKMLKKEPEERLSLDTVLHEIKDCIHGISPEICEEQHTSIEQTICLKFLDLLQKKSLAHTADEMISVFENLSPQERRCVMKAGSIQTFLLQHAKESVVLCGQYLMYNDSSNSLSSSDSDETEPEDPIDKIYILLNEELEKNRDLASKIVGISTDRESELLYVSVTDDNVQTQLQDFPHFTKLKFSPPDNVETDYLTNGTEESYKMPKILPCFGPGSILAEDRDLEGCIAMHQVKRNSVSAMNVFVVKENEEYKNYGSLGCFIVNKEFQKLEYYALSAKHIASLEHNFQGNPISVNKETTLVTALQDQHYIQLPEVVSNKLMRAEIEDCVFVSKGYFGILGEGEFGHTENLHKFIDIGIYGPLSDSLLGVHQIFNPDQNQKRMLDVYKEPYYNLKNRLVQKIGAATGLTMGRILETNYLYRVFQNKTDTVPKLQGRTFLVTSVDKYSLEIEKDGQFGTHGDSGSLVFIRRNEGKKPKKAVGLIQGNIKVYKSGNNVYNNVMVCVYLHDCIDTLVKRLDTLPNEKKLRAENLHLCYYYFNPIFCLGDQGLVGRVEEGATNNISGTTGPSSNIGDIAADREDEIINDENVGNERVLTYVVK